MQKNVPPKPANLISASGDLTKEQRASLKAATMQPLHTSQMTAAQKAISKEAAIEQAHREGAEIINEDDGSVWGKYESFPGMFVKRRLG